MHEYKPYFSLIHSVYGMWYVQLPPYFVALMDVSLPYILN